MARDTEESDFLDLVDFWMRSIFKWKVSYHELQSKADIRTRLWSILEQDSIYPSLIYSKVKRILEQDSIYQDITSGFRKQDLEIFTFCLYKQSKTRW